MKTVLKKFFLIFFLISFLLGIILIFSRVYILSVSDDCIFVMEDIAKIEHCQNVIILGARVYDDGHMSGILRERALAAIDVYNEGDACTILISGDSFGKNGGADEVAAVKAFLIENNVDQDIIIEDGNGFDTFHSMKNARDIFEFDDVLIVTQTFHLPRAVFIARMLGIDALGYTAYKYPYESQWEKRRNFLREYPAAIKAVFEVNFRD